MGLAGCSSLFLAIATEVNDIISRIKEGGFEVVVVDSIQTMYLNGDDELIGLLGQTSSSARGVLGAGPLDRF